MSQDHQSPEINPAAEALAAHQLKDLDQRLHFWHSILLATLLEAPGMVIGLWLLMQPNPRVLALFFFVGLPLILAGMCIYLVMLYRIVRIYKLI